MNVDEENSTSGDLVFSKQFSDVTEGSYQYKIRVGEDHWVVDESREIGMLACLPLDLFILTSLSYR